MVQLKDGGIKVGFESSLRLEFHGAKVTFDVGLIAYRVLDDALGIFDSVSSLLQDRKNPL